MSSDDAVADLLITAEMAKAEKLAETCALKCCDDVIVALPRLETRIKENLSKA